MNNASPVNTAALLPSVYQAFAAAQTQIREQGLDPLLHHLVVLRASQINQCAFCVKMHIREAREDGETNERLDRLVVWEHVNDFTEREKAALAWTEVLTVLDRKTDYAPLRARLREHFSDKEIAALTSTIAMINLWNRLQVSMH
ncbi:MAG: carboxymuconolactone decarboxylase family protein [Alcaligenaceae bacterium]|nr:carboxymuconolactone decarboxylase family protein [Alcaligenaceae bacterium SAGV5]MPS51862.1 carboxymuconolactone decarboxylase family protein [Alcaligenaceae bacterium SAGV3]MPT56053.1 carboxymuconolactone decarboxylase family protein [Alcaligenaceae bacterium]